MNQKPEIRFYFTLSFIVIVVWILFTTSCATKAPTPSYIEIPEVKLETLPNEEGANTHAIVDVWVYVDDNLQGIYPLPANFPIANTGMHKVEVYAGIRKNGLANERFKYPFYISWVDSLDLKPEQTQTITPVFEYFSTKNSVRKTKFYWREDFESAALSIERGNKDTTNSLLRTNDPLLVRTDKFSGFCRMDSSIIIEFISKDGFQLPTNADIVLEIDYKTNTPLSIGFYAYSQSQAIQTPVIDLLETSEWKKAYIYISDEVSNFKNKNIGQNCSFQIYIGTINSGTGDTPEFYLDNIKLVSFE